MTLWQHLPPSNVSLLWRTIRDTSLPLTRKYALRERVAMSTYKTHCPKCGAILSNRFCSACSTDSERPFRKRFLSWFSWMRQYPRLAFWAILGLLGLAFGIVDENVDFFEKHAPKLNAAFHSGEITTSGDGEYVMQKWVADRDKLDDDIKGGGWSVCPGRNAQTQTLLG